MDLTPLHAVLASLDAEVTEAEADRAKAEAHLQRCVDRLATLQAERTGIASYIRRHEGAVAVRASGPSSVPDDSQAPIPRTEAVAQVLADAGTSLAPAEIETRLHRTGRNDTYRDVAAALSHLKARGRATNVARGLWALVTETPQEIEGPDSDYEPPKPEDADYEPSDFGDDGGYRDSMEEPPEEEEEEEGDDYDE